MGQSEMGVNAASFRLFDDRKHNRYCASHV